MNKRFKLLFFIPVIFLFSCIDYESLDTDELEILYRKNKNPEVLPYLCEKYYKKFQEEYLKENYIKNFKNEYKLKTIKYCRLSYEKTGDISSAKILERLYLSNYVNFHKDFLYFLYWAVKAGDTEVIDTFLKNDSKIFATLEHTDALLDYLTKDMKNLLDEEVIHRFEVVKFMLQEYIKNLKGIKNSWLFFTNKEYILEYFRELEKAFDQLIKDMRKNSYIIKEVRENFSQFKSSASKSSRARTYLKIIENLKALIRINIDDFYIFLGRKESLSKEISTAMNIQEQDKVILDELSPIIKRFIEEKNRYLQKYNKIFKEVR
ncbi:hypothetical protein SAMN06265182_0427 [Persephonella hydrogeniphila]|uniref:Lipoprotein n=1 Tax=Persephonella hydrogeniphila TaxID=198703 RepID=A0A285N2C3_9AQUI|nr:hypothetical protein [Persephonella hydrogeniphila]SNZ03625.1 hypothetical protein SAMN06265182_0427 [Persephonella hydrogeniphila]